MKPQGYIPASASPSAHEGADLDIKLVVRTGIVLVSTLAVLIVLIVIFFWYLNHVYANRTSEAAPVVTTADLPPAPRLQVDPAHDLQVVRAREDDHLTRYAWVDRTQGIAQIPIDRAMTLWLQTYTNAPAAAQTPATSGGTTELKMRQDKAKEAAHAP
jgi:hypothetical protein